MITCRRVLSAVVVLGCTLAVMSCGKRETPEEHLARLRGAHDIVPTGATTTFDRDGNPRLVVDLRVTNHSAERLDHLTVNVRVEGADGGERISQPVTLDLSSTRPGVGVQLAALIDGYALADDDQVFVEIPGGLTPEELRALPEFDDLPR
jgi:hypothetical protein